MGRLWPLQQTAGTEYQQVLGLCELQRDTLIGPDEEYPATLQGDYCLDCGGAGCHCALHHQEDAGGVHCQDLVLRDRARDLGGKRQERCSLDSAPAARGHRTARAVRGALCCLLPHTPGSQARRCPPGAWSRQEWAGPATISPQMSFTKRRPSPRYSPHCGLCKSCSCPTKKAPPWTPTYLYLHNCEVWYGGVIEGKAGVFLTARWSKEPVLAGAGGIAEHVTQSGHIDELGCQASADCVI